MRLRDYIVKRALARYTLSRAHALDHDYPGEIARDVICAFGRGKRGEKGGTTSKLKAAKKKSESNVTGRVLIEACAVHARTSCVDLWYYV